MLSLKLLLDNYLRTKCQGMSASDGQKVLTNYDESLNSGFCKAMQTLGKGRVQKKNIKWNFPLPLPLLGEKNKKAKNDPLAMKQYLYDIGPL